VRGKGENPDHLNVMGTNFRRGETGMAGNPPSSNITKEDIALNKKTKEREGGHVFGGTRRKRTSTKKLMRLGTP